jgi:hypothetical protein
MRAVEQILHDIETYVPGSDWLGLHRLLQELFETPVEAIPPEPLLAVFERYPTHDGYGVFWAILHGLEDIPDYETALSASLRRQPSRFGLLMARRVFNVPGSTGFYPHLLDTIEYLATNVSTLQPELAHDFELLVEKLPLGPECD